MRMEAKAADRIASMLLRLQRVRLQFSHRANNLRFHRRRQEIDSNLFRRRLDWRGCSCLIRTTHASLLFCYLDRVSPRRPPTSAALMLNDFSPPRPPHKRPQWRPSRGDRRPLPSAPGPVKEDALSRRISAKKTTGHGQVAVWHSGSVLAPTDEVTARQGSSRIYRLGI